MNDTADRDPARPETTAEPPPPPPPPPGGATAGPRRLHRSRDDRVVAGVCGGLADYFAVDPIVVRLAFVALTMLGGSGVGVYLIAWLVMPPEPRGPRDAAPGGGGTGGRAIVAAAFLVVAVILVSGSLFWSPFDDGLFFPLLVLAAGVALLLWPTDVDGAREWEWGRDREAWHAHRRRWRHGYRHRIPPPPPPASESGASAPIGEEWPAPRPAHLPRPRPFLGPLTSAGLLALTGLTVLADRLDWWHTDPASFLALCLMIIGAVLVVSAFVGRARGLIALGLVILPVAWALAAIDFDWWSGIGEEFVAVEQVEELDDEYRWGIGQFHVDLTDLELDGQTRSVAIGLTIGELKVFVPSSIAVEIDLDGRMGSVIIREGFRRVDDNGLDVHVARAVGDATGGTLILDADIGIGEAEIVVCERGAVPCP